MPLTIFPSQKKSRTEKNPKFFQDCIDVAVTLVDYSGETGIRTSMQEKRINYDLVNNILDPHDVDRIVNPWKMTASEFPVEIRNYPLIKPKLDLLTGEEMRRKFEFRVMLKNADAISEKEGAAKDMFFEFVKAEIMSDKAVNPDRIKQELQRLEQYKNYEMKDIRESMSNQILNYYYYTYKYRNLFNKGFEDALISAEEIYSLMILNHEVKLRKENPLNVMTFSMGDSNYHEDSQIIVIDGYRALGQIIDDYHSDLKPQQIKDLEDGSYFARGPEAGLGEALRLPENYFEELYGEMVYIMPNNALIDTFSGGFDNYGNIRETRVFWKSLRKIGKLSFYDELGVIQEKWVDEDYPVDTNAGETVVWEWVTEWLQGVRLGTDIYVCMTPVPRVTKSMSNPSECVPPIIGTVYNINSNDAMSMVSYVKPYQYLYDAIMYNNELAIIKNRGIVPRLQLHLKPDWMEIEDWIYYFNVLGFAVEDAFKEGNKGAATGKLAGNFQTSGQPINATNVDFIKENMLMLNIIKQQVDDITGISPQRQGAIEQRELVQNVERSVTQSSIITEKWFALHENTKVRVMEAVLDLTRVAWKGKKFQRQYLMDNTTQAILDYDHEVFSSAQYGIYNANNSNDVEIFNALKQMGSMALQAGKARFSDVMAILMSDSFMSIRRRIEDGEQKAEEAAQQATQAQNQSNPADNAKLEMMQKKLDLMQQQIEDKRKNDDRDAAREDEKVAIKKHEVANKSNSKE